MYAVVSGCNKLGADSSSPNPGIMCCIDRLVLAFTYLWSLHASWSSQTRGQAPRTHDLCCDFCSRTVAARRQAGLPSESGLGGCGRHLPLEDPCSSCGTESPTRQHAWQKRHYRGSAFAQTATALRDQYRSVVRLVASSVE